MRRMRWVLAIAASVLACDDPLAPANVTGTYVYAPTGGLQRQLSIDGLDIVTHPAPCPSERTCSGFGLTERFRFRDDAILLLERAGTVDQQLYRRIGPRAP